MNKKRLSVVMAGAMLASSVAPVLAAEAHQTTHGNMGLLINDLEALMETKKFHATDVAKEKGKSVYRFQVIDNATGEDATDGALTGSQNYTIDKKTIKLYSDAYDLKKLDANKNYTIKVYELGSVERNGGFFSTEMVASEYYTYDQNELKALATKLEKGASSSDNNIKAAFTKGWITEAKVEKKGSVVEKIVITLGSLEENGSEHKTIEVVEGSNKIDFTKPVDKDGNDISGLGDNDKIQGLIAGFEGLKKSSSTNPVLVSVVEKNAKLLHEVKVLNGDIHHEIKVDELYDGFMLTEKGHELINAIRKYENDDNSKTTQKVDATVTNGKGTERYFNVTFKDANGTKTVVKVVGDSLHSSKIETLRGWLKAGKAKVELLAGDNRYATAVEIAKTYLAGNSQYSWDENSELVLVNGKALVDGLAAAPYAKQQGAPILLTATDSLPKETREYMKELIAQKTVGDLINKNITVTIVGGDAVVSENVVNELKEIGFKVKRISGDNREETSLAVADKIKTTDKAFIVGAEGEADAMSIAAEAAKDHSSDAGFQTTPIIVAKSVKGLSKVGLNEVSEYANVEIVGGEGVVPASTEETIKELVDNKDNVTRINGKNRFETNALVIKKYHKNFRDALIAKDGQRNKEELVDALPAAIFASSNSSANPSAPIVLATDKISKEQLNQLVVNAKKDSGRTVYQIGHGVNPKTVMQVVVTKLGLNK